MSASIDKGINALKRQVDSSVAAFFSSCVRCGLCAEACLFYTETGDPKRTPINKTEPLRRIWKSEYTLIGRAGKVLGQPPLQACPWSSFGTTEYHNARHDRLPIGHVDCPPQNRRAILELRW